MVNKAVFDTRGAGLPKADAVNEAGGVAYDLGPEQALAQVAVTGCFADGYYVGAGTQLETALELAGKCEPEYVARVACMAREQGYMKDMPAFLVAYLAKADIEVFKRVFDRVIDNGRMLRTFFQILRSGKVGRRGLGTAVKRAIQKWLNDKPNWLLFRWSIGNEPSLSDIIRVAHPKPLAQADNATFAYLRGKNEFDRAALPKEIRHYEVFKWTRLAVGKDKVTDLGDWGEIDPAWANTVPDVEFRLLDSLPLTTDDWKAIFRRGKWMFTRMNINTANRHGVLKDPEMVKLIADRLRDPENVRSARAFPYQLLVAYLMTKDSDTPRPIINALHDAMEIAVENVPAFEGSIAVCVDTSGSMGCPVTGHRGGATTVARYVDVAALIASAILRKAQDAIVLPFDTTLHDANLEPRDTIMTNASKLAGYGGGGTFTALPLRWLNEQRKKIDAVVFVSDQESWVESAYGYYGDNATGVVEEFQKLRRFNGGKTKLVCIDLEPSTTSQVKDVAGQTFQIGGFSDQVFKVVADFINGRLSPEHWVGEIKKIDIDARPRRKKAGTPLDSEAKAG